MKTIARFFAMIALCALAGLGWHLWQQADQPGGEGRLISFSIGMEILVTILLAIRGAR